MLPAELNAILYDGKQGEAGGQKKQGYQQPASRYTMCQPTYVSYSREILMSENKKQRPARNNDGRLFEFQPDE